MPPESNSTLSAAPAPVATDDVVVGADELRTVTCEVLRRAGATEPDAATQSATLVEADLRGQHSHGIRRLPVLIGRLRSGLIRSGVRPVLHWATESVLQVDGGRGFGPVVARTAVEETLERSRTTGIALAAVSNSNHVGMLAPYLEQMAVAGHIGIALTTSEALVHPWGGARAMVGTNPIGIGIPTSGEPLILDMSTASVSMGKVLDYAARGKVMPRGWAVDEHGIPTTDASAAARGAISPFGGAKGYALGIALEALVATLSGTALGTEVTGTLDTEDVSSKGDVFISVSLQRLDLGAMLDPLTDYLDDVRSSGTPGSGPLTVPGDRARTLRASRLSAGVPVHRDVWTATLALLEQ